MEGQDLAQAEELISTLASHVHPPDAEGAEAASGAPSAGKKRKYSKRVSRGVAL